MKEIICILYYLTILYIYISMFVSIDLEIITIQLPSQFSQAEISIFAKHRLGKHNTRCKAFRQTFKIKLLYSIIMLISD